MLPHHWNHRSKPALLGGTWHSEHLLRGGDQSQTIIPAPLTCQAECQRSQGKQRTEHPWDTQSLGKKAEVSLTLDVLLAGSLLSRSKRWGKMEENTEMVLGMRGGEERVGDWHPPSIRILCQLQQLEHPPGENTGAGVSPAWHWPRNWCIGKVRDPEAALVLEELASVWGSHVSLFPSSLLLLPFCFAFSQLLPPVLGSYIPVLQEEVTPSAKMAKTQT